jgi:hypothetical protein
MAAVYWIVGLIGGAIVTIVCGFFILNAKVNRDVKKARQETSDSR